MSLKGKIIKIMMIKESKWVVLLAALGCLSYIVMPKYRFDQNCRYNVVTGRVETLIQKSPYSQRYVWVDIRRQDLIKKQQPLTK